MALTGDDNEVYGPTVDRVVHLVSLELKQSNLDSLAIEQGEERAPMLL
jgi:hypothetical protein